MRELELSCQGAGLTAEGRVVRVGAVPSLDNQLAVGKVMVVSTGLRQDHVLNRNGGRVTSLAVAVISLASVEARVGLDRAVDNQGVVALYNLFQKKLDWCLLIHDHY